MELDMVSSIIILLEEKGFETRIIPYKYVWINRPDKKCVLWFIDIYDGLLILAPIGISKSRVELSVSSPTLIDDVLDVINNEHNQQ